MYLRLRCFDLWFWQDICNKYESTTSCVYGKKQSMEFVFMKTSKVFSYCELALATGDPSNVPMKKARIPTFFQPIITEE